MKSNGLELERKMAALDAWLRGQGGVLIGFSGGVDSTFLAAMAVRALGRRARAVTVDSAFMTRAEMRAAAALARRIGIRRQVVRVDVLADGRLTSNPPDRCYHCKKRVFAHLRRLARAQGIACVCDGGNVDDAGDYRPGERAVHELGVRSPLKETGFTKDEIRAASRRLRLPTADKPALACLASRVPYGTTITAEGLAAVERAEAALQRLGFRQCRVRLHGDVGRVEVPPAELRRAFSRRAAVVAALQAAGLRYPALDLQGYRTGSLNEALARRRAQQPSMRRLLDGARD
jgi:uncharacterized protein